MHTEDDLLPISALQHMVFCPRQCGLIHIERMWSENRLTAQGRIMHDKVHDSPGESRGDLYIARGLRLKSLALGLSGQADVVEFHLAGADDDPAGCVELAGRDGRWTPFPVEYKRGKPKRGGCDKVQLCAQAICLEEMLGVPIARGALFYGKTRRRLGIEFDADLRAETLAAARRVHEMFASGETPPPLRTPACKSCSMEAVCLPRPSEGSGKAARYVSRTLKAIAGESAETRGTEL
ncbi:MAG: CRISPR-associated protein Cas4 [Planctomycetes bacterium]|nr:CRISPR-associated protein Cas4 [Planctomycetota bacterium]